MHMISSLFKTVKFSCASLDAFDRENWGELESRYMITRYKQLPHKLRGHLE